MHLAVHYVKQPLHSLNHDAQLFWILYFISWTIVLTTWGKTSSSFVCHITIRLCCFPPQVSKTKVAVFDICLGEAPVPNCLTVSPLFSAILQSGWPGSWQICPLPTTTTTSCLKSSGLPCVLNTMQHNARHKQTRHSGVGWLVFVRREWLMLQFHSTMTEAGDQEPKGRVQSVWQHVVCICQSSAPCKIGVPTRKELTTAPGCQNSRDRKKLQAFCVCVTSGLFWLNRSVVLEYVPEMHNTVWDEKGGPCCCKTFNL